MKTSFIFLLFLLLIGCSQSVKENNTPSSIQSDLEDGIYLMVENLSGDGNSDTLKTVQFSKLFDDKTDTLAYINQYEFVPLVLASNPATENQVDGRKKLFLQLTKEAGERLEKFTKKHITKKAAIIIGTKVITVHKIRTVIEGGKLQITRCTDDACEVLYLELQDNVIGMPK